MDYWHDEHLEDMVEAYRKNRDPAPLTRLINFDYDAMQAPAIGRLFLDIINGRLPPLEHRPESTSEIRERAIELVFFYLGSNIKKTKAYAAAGLILGKSGDTIKGYMNDWLKEFTVWGWPDDAITKSDFWADTEKYLVESLRYRSAASAFLDGKAMVDDDLAKSELSGLSHRDIDWYRNSLKNLHEKQKPIEFDDPWELQEKLWLIRLELDRE